MAIGTVKRTIELVPGIQTNKQGAAVAVHTHRKRTPKHDIFDWVGGAGRGGSMMNRHFVCG